MAQAEEPTTPPASTPDLTPQLRRYGPSLLKVAWLSIVLGLAMEMLLLLLAISLGNAQSAKPFLAELTQKISWSVIVCVGLAFGKVASKTQLGLAGLLGLISAPLGFEVARAVHKGAGQALSVTLGPPTGVSIFALALTKGIEYGCLGLAIAWAVKRRRIGVRGHVGVGLAFGLVFGGVTLALTVLGGGPAITPAVLVAWAVNELMFPVGCSLILYSTAVLGAPRNRQRSRSSARNSARRLRPLD